MIRMKLRNQKTYVISGILLLISGLLFPLISQSAWFNIIVKIREAVNTGDSGHLILASASTSFLYAAQSTMFFLSIVFLVYVLVQDAYHRFSTFIIAFSSIILLHFINGKLTYLPWEVSTTVLATLVALFLSAKILGETNSFFYVSIISVQIFFAFQWLNIMPSFSSYMMGQTDVPYSIKIAGTYLKTSSVLNFMGFAFFLPFLFSAFISTALFINNSQKISIVRENYKKEKELQNIKGKALKNRIYQEINFLVHDLKTPLVTVRGLNSLLPTCKDEQKLSEYSDRIEDSVNKMNEMISSFLNDSSRQILRPSELLNYIRAQLPIDDDSIRIEIEQEEDLPDLCVNKVRIARAMINILENAIVAPSSGPYKHIKIELRRAAGGVNFKIEDNGIGIYPEDMAKIWDVGFSTGSTSGLGLPFAKQIIEDHKGFIEITSKREVGTSAKIFLPSV